MTINPYAIPGLKNCKLYIPGKVLGNPEQVLEIICEELGTPIETVRRPYKKGKGRKLGATTEIAETRQIFSYIMKRNTQLSLKKIGTYLGGQDHTTIRHSFLKAKDYFDTEESYRQRVARIENKILSY